MLRSEQLLRACGAGNRDQLALLAAGDDRRLPPRAFSVRREPRTALQAHANVQQLAAVLAGAHGLPFLACRCLAPRSPQAQVEVLMEKPRGGVHVCRAV